jgi:hypothetical protein
MLAVDAGFSAVLVALVDSYSGAFSRVSPEGRLCCTTASDCAARLPVSNDDCGFPGRIGRFPAALALMPDRSCWEDLELPCDRNVDALEGASRLLVSLAPDVCELGRRITCGRRLDTEVEATYCLLDWVTDFFPPFSDEEEDPCDICVVAVTLPDDAPESLASSIPGRGGDAKRAVGRGPDVLDGALGFFKIDCFGGGFDEEEETAFIRSSGSGRRAGNSYEVFEISSNNRASCLPLNLFRSLPHTCHQKFSKRLAVGSASFRCVIVYTAT